jgi:hypothetical protein
MIWFAWWLALFGVWPLAHPEHDTYTYLMTWVDLALHVVGIIIVIPRVYRWFERVNTMLDEWEHAYGWRRGK